MLPSYAPETTSGAESSMPSKHTHRKEKVTEKRTYGKFSCLAEPKHEECDGVWTIFHNTSRKCGYEWKVKWAACREERAIEFMKTEHGHTYNPNPPNENDSKPVVLYSKKKPHLVRFVYGIDSRPNQKHRPAKVASRKHHPQAQAADRQQSQHHQAQPPRVSTADGERFLHRLQQDSRGQQRNDPRVEEWVAKHEAPEMAMPSDQSRVWHEDTAPPPGMARAQDMAAAPVMPPPQEAIPDGQQPKRRHHRSKHRPKPEQAPSPSAMMSPDASAGPTRPPAVLPAPVIHPPRAPSDGQRQGRRRHKSRRGHEPQLEHHPQEYPTMSPGGTVVLPTGMSMPVPPPMPSDQGLMDGQQHQSHRLGLSGHFNLDQTPLSPADLLSPPTMRESMAVMAEEAMSAPAEEPQARGMAIAPRMPNMPSPMNPVMSAPPTRNMPMRQRPQHVPGMSPAPPTIGTSMSPPTMPVTSTQNTALSPAGQAPSGMSGPPNMRLPVAASQAEGIVTAPGMTSMPPPTIPTMTARSTTQNIAQLPGPQPGPGMSPAPPAAGMYRPPRTQLSPMEAPQAEGITTAAGPSGPPPQNPPLRQPRPQPTKPGVLLQAAGAAGTPGAQAMTLRRLPGELSSTPGMPPNPSMQPPPMSMPPFPGTGPGTPASMELAAAPPPPVPTPPLYPGTLD